MQKNDLENQFQLILQRRMKHEPFAYISGEKEFYNSTFKVNKNTLIPRPDSELLVDTTLEILQSINITKPVNVLELGVGSGAIILSIMKEIKTKFNHLFHLFKWKGTDISKDAILTAKSNAKSLNLREEITFEEKDWIEEISLDDFDIIISNPPYISSSVIETLHPTVKE